MQTQKKWFCFADLKPPSAPTSSSLAYAFLPSPSSFEANFFLTPWFAKFKLGPPSTKWITRGRGVLLTWFFLSSYAERTRIRTLFSPSLRPLSHFHILPYPPPLSIVSSFYFFNRMGGGGVAGAAPIRFFFSLLFLSFFHLLCFAVTDGVWVSSVIVPRILYSKAYRHPLWLLCWTLYGCVYVWRGGIGDVSPIELIVGFPKKGIPKGPPLALDRIWKHIDFQSVPSYG